MLNNCAVCNRLSYDSLCDEHKKYFTYYKEHEFFASKAGRKISGPQFKLFKTVREAFHLQTFQEVIFKFSGRKRYDIVVPKLKLIVEADGEQHFKHIKFFAKTKADWEKQKESDKIKEKMAKENGYTVVRFSYKESIEQEYIKNKILYKLEHKEIS